MKLSITIFKNVMLLFASVLLWNCGSNFDNDTSEPNFIFEEEEVRTDGKILVSSIKELNRVLLKSNIDVIMAPGTYNIGPEDVESKLIIKPTFFEVLGENCTYDFTGVTFEFDTEIFRSFGSVAVHEFRVVGKNNVVKNLTIADIGDTPPSKTALAVLLDGLDNRIEGFHISARGSSPYGYGDVFGKGAPTVLSHKKHASVLIRGERNHLKNCTIVQKTYGHGIFVQGGIDTLIEGCELYGDETRTSDSILAEEGTGTRADGVDFMTVWGYRLTPGWMFSKHEDGIRAYSTGPHYITGETIHTTNMIVRDCTIRNFRSGVTIGFCNDTKIVENCVATGTEGAFWVGTLGEVINCKGDAAYGSVYGTAYQHDRDSKIDITLVDAGNVKYGDHPLMYLGGSGHDVTLKTEETSPSQNSELMISGENRSIRFEQGREDTYYKQSSNNISLTNHTSYPITLGTDAANSIVETCAPATDGGTANSITTVTCN
jgi:hypothetical protein